MDITTEKARLRKLQTTEFKAMDKEFKKKKPGPQRDALQIKLEEMTERHVSENKALNDKYGVSNSITTPTPKKQTDKPTSNVEANNEILAERNWCQLGRRELENECKKRSLSKNGSKEDMVTRLLAFSSKPHSMPVAVPSDNESLQCDQPRRVIDDVSDEEIERAIGQNVQTEDTAAPQYEVATSKRGRGRNRKMNKWGRGRAARGGGDREEVERRNRDVNKQKSDEDEEEDSNDSDSQDDEEIQRQKKRERIMLSVLKEILKRNPNGVQIDDLTEHFAGMNVLNFTPQLLGFPSLDKWLRSQPKDEISYDRKQRSLLPFTEGLDLPYEDSDEDTDEDATDDDN